MHSSILFSGCYLNFNFVSRIKPRCIWLTDIVTWDWLKGSGFGLLLTILRDEQTLIAFLGGSGLNFIFHWKAHFFSDFFKSWHFENNKDVPSVNILQIDWIPSGKFLQYILRKGVKGRFNRIAFLVEHQKELITRRGLTNENYPSLMIS